MSLKTSFFNKSLFKSDLKRFWWIGAIYFGLILISYNFPLITGYYRVGTADTNIMSATFLYFLALLMPVITGVMLFSYMQSGKAVSMLHSIPVSRLEHYVTHITSGLIISIVPILINWIILIAFGLDGGFAAVVSANDITSVMLISITYSLLTFTAACAVSMICGNTAASFIFTYVLGLLPAMIEGFLSFFMESCLYGYEYNNEYSVITFLYKDPYNLCNNYLNILFYFGIAVVFAICGYFVYKRRRLEKHSEVVAFSWLRPVFVFGSGAWLGAFGYIYVNGVWGFKNPLWLIPFGIIGIIASEMIVKKSFKVFGVYKKLIGYTAIILLLFVGFRFDITGYVRRVPEINDVKSVTFISNFHPAEDVAFDTKGNKIYPDKTFSPDFTEKKDIETLIKYHKAQIAKKDIDNDDSETTYITLIYNLKDGKTLKRTYLSDTKWYKSALKDIRESDIMRKYHLPILRDSGMKILSVNLENIWGSTSKTIDGDDAQRVVEALKADLREAQYDDYMNAGDTLCSVEIIYQIPSHYADSTPVPEDKNAILSSYYGVISSYKRTYALLQELGCFDSIPKPEEISAVGIDYFEGADTSATYSNVTYNKVIITPEEIKEVYDYIIGSPRDGKYYDSEYDAEITVYYKGTMFGTQINTKAPNVPKCLKK